MMSKSTLLGISPLAALIATAMSSNFAGAATVGGTATNAAIVVPGVAWTVLQTQPIPVAAWPRHCVATGSADAIRPTATPGEFSYNFTVSNGNPVLDQGQERTLTFFNQIAFAGGPTILDNRVKEITTTGGWMAGAMNNPGYFTFPAGVGGNIFFLARKVAAAFPNLTVDDASLTVVCTTGVELPLPSPTGPIPLP